MSSLKEAVEQVLMDADYTSDYSGRYMYGEQCIGFTTYEPLGLSIARVMVHIARSDLDFAEVLADAVAVDSMGRGWIVYFPGIQETGNE